LGSESKPDYNTKQDFLELKNLAWFNFISSAPEELPKPVYISIMEIKKESSYERKLRMLNQLSSACLACSMCELGLKEAIKNNEARDPHVFSNLNPKRIIVVGQNPGWEELKKRKPFVGAAGKIFDQEIGKHGLSRDDFYICNTVRCFTAGNTKPTNKHKSRCKPFLQMEISLIKPKLVIALGAVAFSQLCPDAEFSSGLKNITKSTVFDVNVFAIYHPSPLNFLDSGRKLGFEDQIRVMCALVKRLK